jgi:enamine deaminase RidA (YjgF/YER057c/UK114 family)
VTPSRADERRQRIARSTHVLDVAFAGPDECHLVAAVAAGANATKAADAVYADVADVLRKHALEPVHERLFGSVQASSDVLGARAAVRDVLPDVAPTYIEGGPCAGAGFAGIDLHAVRATVRTLHADGRPVGRTWTRDGATHLVLQGVDGVGGSPEAKPSEQAALMIERARRLLEAHGANYIDVVRTWFYLADILDWYGDFNRIRNQAYGDFGLTGAPLHLPASTGIAGRNPAGSACVMDLRAIVNGPAVSLLSSSRQQDAFRYGSAFSRAARWDEGGCRHMLVSGTASIDEHGDTCHPGDFAAQARRTLENVEALLTESEMRWDDVVAATVFLNRPEDLDSYRAVAAERGIAEMPHVVVVADICRAELLFEIEVTAGRG